MFKPRAPSFVALVLTTLVAALIAVGSSSVASGASPDADATQPYIVVLEDSARATSEASEHVDDYGITAKQVYSHALQGYAADLTAEQVAELESDDSVAYVDEDVVLHTQQNQPVPTGVQRIFGPDNPHLGIGGPDDIRVDVDVAVVDTGVIDHSDLDVVDRVDCTGFSGCTPGGTDDNGHGTHVAGSAAAINNGSGVVGVAPGARIWAQKVCGAGGQCSQSAIVGGIDYVAANADTIEVANMSLGGPGTNQPIADAITAAVDAGVVFVVAAGNDNQDARNFQPANHPLVVTVSALADSDGQPGGTGGAPSCRPQSPDDNLADFSNWGAAVNIAAPGVCINSTWNDGGYNVISGTSMASPHGAGAAAVLTSGGNGPTDRAGVLAVRDTLESTGNLDWTWQSRGSGDFQEPLLDISDGDVYPPDPGDPGEPGAPVATFDFTCDDASLTCDFDGSASAGDSDVASWDWEFGDGETGTGETTSHTYGAADTYSVTLTVTDTEGLTGSTTEQVAVGEPPSGGVGAAFTDSCTVFFIWLFCSFDGTGSSGDIAAWNWDFGDGSSGSGSTTSHFYGSTGPFTVTLTVTGTDGGTDSTSRTVP